MGETSQDTRHYYLPKELRYQSETQEFVSLAKNFAPSVQHFPPSDKEISILINGVESIFRSNQEILPNEMNYTLNYLSNFLEKRTLTDTFLIWKDINSSFYDPKELNPSYRNSPVITKRIVLHDRPNILCCGNDFVFSGKGGVKLYSLHKKWWKTIPIYNYSNLISSSNNMLYFIQNNRSIFSLNPYDNKPQVLEFCTDDNSEIDSFKTSDTAAPIFATYSSYLRHLHYGNIHCYQEYSFEFPLINYDLDSNYLYFADHINFSFAEEDRIVSAIKFDNEISSFSLIKNSNSVVCFGEKFFSLLDLRIGAEVACVQTAHKILECALQELSHNCAFTSDDSIFVYDKRSPETALGKISVEGGSIKAKFIKGTSILAVASSGGQCTLYDVDKGHIKQIDKYPIGCGQITEMMTTNEAVAIHQPSELNLIQLNTRPIYIPDII